MPLLQGRNKVMSDSLMRYRNSVFPTSTFFILTAHSPILLFRWWYSHCFHQEIAISSISLEVSSIIFETRKNYPTRPELQCRMSTVQTGNWFIESSNSVLSHFCFLSTRYNLRAQSAKHQHTTSSNGILCDIEFKTTRRCVKPFSDRNSPQSSYFIVKIHNLQRLIPYRTLSWTLARSAKLENLADDFNAWS